MLRADWRTFGDLLCPNWGLRQALSPNQTTVLYWNNMLDFSFYAAHAAMEALEAEGYAWIGLDFDRFAHISRRRALRTTPVGFAVGSAVEFAVGLAVELASRVRGSRRGGRRAGHATARPCASPQES